MGRNWNKTSDDVHHACSRSDLLTDWSWFEGQDVYGAQLFYADVRCGLFFFLTYHSIIIIIIIIIVVVVVVVVVVIVVVLLTRITVQTPHQDGQAARA